MVKQTDPTTNVTPWRWILANVALIGMALAWLVPFVCILRYGTHLVAEPSRPILILELCLFAATVVFGIDNLRKAQ